MLDRVTSGIAMPIWPPTVRGFFAADAGLAFAAAGAASTAAGAVSATAAGAAAGSAVATATGAATVAPASAAGLAAAGSGADCPSAVAGANALPAMPSASVRVKVRRVGFVLIASILIVNPLSGTWVANVYPLWGTLESSGCQPLTGGSCHSELRIGSP
ncbi:MAG: hypothetical protein EXR75_09700 [Myxococcales bacterium]|nr:hypothetical protein [Myxococcales bacterium]